MTVRAAVILLIAIVVAVLAGLLSYQVDGSLPGATLWAGGAGGGAIALFHRIVSRG